MWFQNGGSELVSRLGNSLACTMLSNQLFFFVSVQYVCWYLLGLLAGGGFLSSTAVTMCLPVLLLLKILQFWSQQVATVVHHGFRVSGVFVGFVICICMWWRPLVKDRQFAHRFGRLECVRSDVMPSGQVDWRLGLFCHQEVDWSRSVLPFFRISLRPGCHLSSFWSSWPRLFPAGARLRSLNCGWALAST